MIQQAHDKLLVQVKTKWIKNFDKIMKVAAANNLSVNQADCVNIVGTVHSLPKKITNDREHKGFTTDDIEIGDTVIFSHQVIFDMDETYKEDVVYKNRLWWKGQEYFKADITNIFAVIRDEEIIMLNGWVMLTMFQDSKIILPQYMKSMKKTAKAQVLHIGYSKTTEKPIDVFQNDWVYFNPFTAQTYQINDKPFVILPQEKILGKDA